MKLIRVSLHSFRQLYLLGYIPQHNRIYVCDKDVSIYAYSLSLSVIEYQSAILRGDLEAANGLLPSIPNDQRNKIARFLELQGEYISLNVVVAGLRTCAPLQT
jgi:coatomer subunit beta'